MFELINFYKSLVEYKKKIFLRLILPHVKKLINLDDTKYEIYLFDSKAYKVKKKMNKSVEKFCQHEFEKKVKRALNRETTKISRQANLSDE